MRILVSMATTTKKLRLRRGDRRVLESWVRSRTLPRRQVERAKIVLAAFRGESSRGIAASVGIARDTARLWMRRYEADGLVIVYLTPDHPVASVGGWDSLLASVSLSRSAKLRLSLRGCG